MPRTRKITKKGRSKSGNFRSKDCDEESICESVSSLGLNEYKDNTSDYESDKEFGFGSSDFLKVLNEKSSSQDRINMIRKMSNYFSNNYIPGYMLENQSEIIESLKKILKRGEDGEKSAVADLVPLVCLQFECESELLLEIGSTLQRTYQDATERDEVRAKCCNSLAMLLFLSGNDIQDVIRMIEDISRQISVCFSSAGLVKVTQSTFYAAALRAQNLLLTLLESNNIIALFQDNNSPLPSIEQYRYMLSSDHVDLRLESGVSLAIIYEIGRLRGTEFGQKSLEQLMPIVEDLATVSHKCRNKKQQKSQRITFRPIKDFLESPTAVFNDHQHIKFKKDVIDVDSWCKLKQYEQICDLLGSGLHVHIAKNQIVRNIFDLSALPVAVARKQIESDAGDESRRRLRKTEKNLTNSAISKSRSIDRKKARNKRSIDFDDC